MRVLVFGMSGTIRGGIESFLLNMNHYMSDECIFDYIFMEESTVHKDVIEENGGKAICITSYHNNPIKNVIDLIKVLRENKKEHPIAYFNLFSMVHMFPVVLCKILGYKIVLHSHNNNLQQKSKIYRWLHNFNRAIFAGLKCMRLTNSDASTEFMFGKNKQAVLIYNAIDLEKFKYNDVKREQIRDELGISDKIVIGFSGRLAPPKNPLFLVDVFEAIYKQNHNTLLLIAGEGELRSDIEKSISEKNLADVVIMLGNRTDIEDIYQVMDVFLLPSLFEGLGIVLIEAQTEGLPCVASAQVIPELADITPYIRRENLNASVEEWGSTVLELIKQCKDNNRLNGFEFAKASNFDITNEAPRLECILKDYSK